MIISDNSVELRKDLLPGLIGMFKEFFQGTKLYNGAYNYTVLWRHLLYRTGLEDWSWRLQDPDRKN